MSTYLPHHEGDDGIHLEPEDVGCRFAGLRVLSLAAGDDVEFRLDGGEAVVLPLTGSAEITVADERFELRGRASVFDGPSDCVYAPLGSTVRVRSERGGRFAVATARCEEIFPVRYVPAADIPVELRGAGSASRQVHNFATPGVLDAHRLIACEVLTPAGNWSSYPPHKHDEESATESELEEIYFFEVGSGPGGPGFAYQRVYGHDGEDDLLEEVRSGDTVVIPRGWHGPSMAAPGYDLYYLNVMAGPGERDWRVQDDPCHGWVRSTWPGQAVDPRLPFGRDRAV
ncbi:5-deoxy-glucuronate isomerase [Amycolatopsis sp. CA-161197]|uniref:5-deoxy-glucuronate isomerase n=1 Tax=Amycolatopsis sp. CA-161197 TaxID=3239922 RepID=UPI003D931157